MSSATACAQPNIALVKYWGKRDEKLILPATGSLSMTLDSFTTTTSVHVGEDADSFTLNGSPASLAATQRTTGFLELVRELAGDDRPAAVVSTNRHPPAPAWLPRPRASPRWRWRRRRPTGWTSTSRH